MPIAICYLKDFQLHYTVHREQKKAGKKVFKIDFFCLDAFLQLCAIAQTRLLLHDLLNGGCIEKRQLIMRSLWGQNLYEYAIFVY